MRPAKGPGAKIPTTVNGSACIDLSLTLALGRQFCSGAMILSKTINSYEYTIIKLFSMKKKIQYKNQSRQHPLTFLLLVYLKQVIHLQVRTIPRQMMCQLKKIIQYKNSKNSGERGNKITDRKNVNLVKGAKKTISKKIFTTIT